MRLIGYTAWVLCLALLIAVEAVIRRPCWYRCVYQPPAIKKGPWQRDQYFTPNFDLTSWFDLHLKNVNSRAWNVMVRDFNPIGVGRIYVKPNEKHDFHVGFVADPVKFQDVYAEYHPGEIISELNVTMDVIVNNGRIGAACNAASLKYNLPAKWEWDGRLGSSVLHRGRWQFTKNQPLEILDGHYDMKFPYQDKTWNACIAFYIDWRTDNI